MCKYCEKDSNGLFKPLARNSQGGNASLVELGVSENTGQPVLFVNYDESEPLQVGINFCPVCGSRLAPEENVIPLEDRTFRPDGVGTYTVQLDNDTNVAIPNPCNDYRLFCDVIRKIATGVYDGLNDREWSITRLWRLLNKRVKGLNVIYDSRMQVLSVGKWSEVVDARLWIATEDYMFRPQVIDGDVIFTNPVAWDKATDEDYKFLEFVLQKIADHQLTLKARKVNQNET